MLKTSVKILLILILVFILILAFFRNSLCRIIIHNAATKATGLKLSIKQLNLNLLKCNLHMRGITLLNPPGFKNEILGRAEEIFISYDLPGLLKGSFHFPEARVHINEINIIRNEKGSSNISTFKRKRLKAKPSGAKPPADISSSAPTQSKVRSRKHPRPKFLIDSLELSVDKVAFVNYTAGADEPAVIIFTSSDPFVFKNVSNLNYVIDSISTKGGFRNLLSAVVGLIPQDMFKNTQETLKSTTEAIKKKLQEVLPQAK